MITLSTRKAIDSSPPSLAFADWTSTTSRPAVSSVFLSRCPILNWNSNPHSTSTTHLQYPTAHFTRYLAVTFTNSCATIMEDFNDHNRKWRVHHSDISAMRREAEWFVAIDKLFQPCDIPYANPIDLTTALVMSILFPFSSLFST